MVRDLKFLQSLLQAYYDSPRYTTPQNAERAFQNDMKHTADTSLPDTPENREKVLTQVRNGKVKEDIIGQDVPLQDGEETIFLTRFNHSSIEIRPGRNAQSYNKPRRKIAGMKSWIKFLKSKEERGETVKYPSYYNRSLGKITIEGDEYSIRSGANMTRKEPLGGALDDAEEEKESLSGTLDDVEEDKEPLSGTLDDVEEDKESLSGTLEKLLGSKQRSLGEEDEDKMSLGAYELESLGGATDEDRVSMGGTYELESHKGVDDAEDIESDDEEPVMKQSSFQIKQDGIYFSKNGIERKIDELEDISSQPDYILDGLRIHPQVNVDEDEDGVFATYIPSETSLKTGVTGDFQEELLQKKEEPENDDKLASLQAQFSSLDDEGFDPFAFELDEEAAVEEAASEEAASEEAKEAKEAKEAASGEAAVEEAAGEEAAVEEAEKNQTFEFYERPSPLNPARMEYFIKTVNEDDEPAFQSVEDFTLEIEEYMDEDATFQKVTNPSTIQIQQQLIDQSLENED